MSIKFNRLIVNVLKVSPKSLICGQARLFVANIASREAENEQIV